MFGVCQPEQIELLGSRCILLFVLPALPLPLLSLPRGCTCGRTHTRAHACACVHTHQSSSPALHRALPAGAGILKKVEKDERKAAIAVELAKFAPSRPDLYLPTNPDCRVVNHIHNSGTPMQSAAKVGVSSIF